MKNRYFILCLLLATIILPLSSQNANNEPIRERIYMQTDKQLYMTGELIWMKLFTTSPDGLPQTFSKIAYVELWDEEASQIQAKTELTNGVGNGWMITPLNLPTGHYRLVAYTRNMRNESTNVFFEKNIGIINPLILDQSAERSGSNISSVFSSSTKDDNLSLSTDKRTYSKREKVNLKIDQFPDDIHTLSVSVVGDDFVNIVGGTELKQWKNQLQSKKSESFSGNFLPEYEGHIVEGKLINVATGKQEHNELIKPYLTFRSPHIALFPGKIDDKGNVTFFTNHTAGIKEIVSSPLPISLNIDNIYRIDIDYPFVEKMEVGKLPTLDISNINKDYLMQRNVALQVLYSYTNDSINQFAPTRSYFNWEPDHTYVMDEYTRFATMQEVITEFVVYTRFRKINDKRFLSIYDINTNTFSSGLTFVFLDGVPIFDHEIIYNYDPTLLKRIDVYKDSFAFGSQMVNGIVFFTTHKGDYAGLKLDESTQFFDYEGAKPYRAFHSPAYTTEEERQSRLPDFRHTLLWNPDVQTEGETSVSIPFYTSDLTGKFQIIIEGLTKTGEIIYATSDIEVR